MGDLGGHSAIGAARRNPGLGCRRRDHRWRDGNNGGARAGPPLEPASIGFFGGILLDPRPSLILHWAIEHVAGHHRRVATPEDPATARLDEPLLAFMARSLSHGFLSAWKLKSARNARRDVQSPLRNRILCGSPRVRCRSLPYWACFGRRAALLLRAERGGHRFSRDHQLHRALRPRAATVRLPGCTSASRRCTPGIPRTGSRMRCFSTYSVIPTITSGRRARTTAAAPPRKPATAAGYAGMALLAMIPAALAAGDDLEWKLASSRAFHGVSAPP